MSKCYIIWAGNVWSSIAYSTLHQDIYSQIILVDIFEQFAKAQAMDMADAWSAMSCDTVVRFGDLTDLEDDDFVVITAWIPQKDATQSRLELVDQNKKVMTEITDKIKSTNKFPIICVVSNPVDILTNHIYEQLPDYPQQRIFGSGTFLDSSRLRLVISQKHNIPVSKVNAVVMWEYWDSSISLLSIANNDGANIFTNPEEKDYQDYNSFVSWRAYDIIAGKKSTYYGIWVCISQIAKILKSDKSQIMPLSIKINWQYGIDNWCCSILVSLSSNWWSYIPDISMSEYELQKLQQSAANLANYN